MRIAMQTALVGLALAILLCGTSTAQSPTTDKLWHSDWTKARALAKTQQKPLLVLFR